MNAKAIVFEAPLSLQVRELAFAPMGPTDITVAVDFSGISTGTERLLWEGTMPPFPGLAYPLVPGYETVGQVVAIGNDVSTLAVGDTVFLPGSYAFQGVQTCSVARVSDWWRLRIALSNLTVRLAPMAFCWRWQRLRTTFLPQAIRPRSWCTPI